MQAPLRSFFIFLLITILHPCFAQNGVLSGKVTDANGEPLEGVTVEIKGKNKTTVTASDGTFKISNDSGGRTLVFSRIGYAAKEIEIGPARDFIVVLNEASQDLGEVVIVGYGSQRKATVTGAITSVSGDEILKSPVSNVTNSLIGRLTGVSVVQRSGAPGQNAGLINIRGVSTYNNTSAIVVVDGVERSDFGDLDPNEIENITVLKDAASTAIFGIRGANGVIMVTTRGGREGKPRVSYTGNVSAQTFTGVPKALDAYHNALLINEANRNDALPESWTEVELQKFKDGSDPIWYPNIDWFDYLTRDFYTQTQHNVNVSGGTKMVKYFASVGYLFEDGIFKKFESPYGFKTTPSYTRYNFRSNVDFTLTNDLTVSLKLSGRLRKRYQPAGPEATSEWGYDHLEAMISRIVQTPAFAFPVTLPNGAIAQAPDVGTNIWNPYAVITRWGTRQDDNNNIEATFQLNYKLDRITEGLSFRTTFGYDSYFSSFVRRNATWQAYNILNRENGTIGIASDRPRDEPLGPMNVFNDGLINSNVQVGLNYVKKVSDHDITALVLGTRQTINRRGSGIDAAPVAIQGIVGRVTYNYDTRYFLELNAAYNGSENFAPGKQYGFFPAISFGWTLTNESFMRSADWLNYFKIRGSYGLVGNDKLSDRFLFLSNYAVQSSAGSAGGISTPGNAVRFGLPNSPVTYQVVTQTMFGNPEVTWEKGLKRNLGIEARFLNDDLSLTFDVFDETRTDILTTRSSGLTMYGQDYPAVNIGEVYNKGYELELNYKTLVGAFNINLNAQLSYSTNVIRNRDEPPGQPDYQKQEGKRVGQFFGYMTAGFYQSAEDISNWPVNTLTSRVIPGDLKFVDYNKDGRIDADDRVAIGYSRIPEYIYSVTPTISWNNLSLSLMFQGVANVSSDVILTEQNNGQVMFEPQLGRWTPETAESATWPALHSRGVTNANYQLNDFILQDASYLKLRNAELSWMLPRHWLKKINVSSIRTFLTGQNLITWTKFKMGMDPENINLNRTAFTKTAIYPTPRIFNLGVNVQF